MLPHKPGPELFKSVGGYGIPYGLEKAKVMIVVVSVSATIGHSRQRGTALTSLSSFEEK